MELDLGEVMENARNRFRTDPILGDVMVRSEAVTLFGDPQRNGIGAFDSRRKEEARFTIESRAVPYMFRDKDAV